MSIVCLIILFTCTASNKVGSVLCVAGSHPSCWCSLGKHYILCAHTLIPFHQFSSCDISEKHRTLVKLVYICGQNNTFLLACQTFTTQNSFAKRKNCMGREVSQKHPYSESGSHLLVLNSPPSSFTGLGAMAHCPPLGYATPRHASVYNCVCVRVL